MTLLNSRAATAPEPSSDLPAASTPAVGRHRWRAARRWIGPVLVVCLLDAGGLAWYHRHTAAAGAGAATSVISVVGTATLAVAPATLKQTVSATGTLAPAVDSSFGFAVSGIVSTVRVHTGEKVSKGEILATVNPISMRVSLAQARASLAADRATLAADKTADASATQIAADKAVITEAAATVVTARANLADAVLVAPVAGELATFDLAVGDSVTGSSASDTASSTGSSASTSGGTGSTGTGTGTGATTSGSTTADDVEIIGTSSWEVASTVDDTDIGKLAVGDETTITLSDSSAGSSSSGPTGGAGGFPGAGGTGGAGQGGTSGMSGSTTTSTSSDVTVYGTVTSIGLVPSTTSGVAAYPVVVTVTPTSTALYSGMTATATITYRQLTNVLAVPTSAIITTGTTHTVQVSLNGKTTVTPVTVGTVVGTETVITRGLMSGQDIVVTSTGRRTTDATTGSGAAGGAVGRYTGGAAAGTGAFPGTGGGN